MILSVAIFGLVVHGTERKTLSIRSGLSVQELVVAGTPKDFMIARHLKVTGTNQQIGSVLTKIAVERHGYKAGFTDLALTNHRRNWFQANFPVMVERSHGVIEILKEPKIDPFGLTYDMMTGPGCSTVFYPGTFTESGHSVLSRNYDFFTKTYAELTGRTPPPNSRAFTADPYILELHPTKGYASLAIVSYDLLMGCVDGINEKGLTVALLADDMSRGARPSRGNQVGLGEIEIPRFLLETCATVEEVIKATKDLQRYYSFIPCHYIVGDAKGNSCAIEWSVSNGKWSVVRGDGKPQIVTNHLVSEFQSRSSFPSDPDPRGSFNRYCKLEDQLAGIKGKLRVEKMKELNQSVAAGANTSRNPKNGRTLWHSIYDTTAKSLEVSFYLGEATDGSLKSRKSPYLKFSLR